MINNAVLALVVVFFVALAGLFAGAETGLYTLSRLRLRLGIEKKRLPFFILGKVMQNSGAQLISMLIGMNLAQYFATSIVTTLLLNKLGAERATLLTTITIAPVLFVFSEMIPKNVFFYRADLIMPYVSLILYTSHKLFVWSGVVPLLRFLSGILTRVTRTYVPPKVMIAASKRHQVEAILSDTREEGIVSPIQAEMIHRVVNIPHVQVKSVMIPITGVEMVDMNCDRSVLLNKLKSCAYTRLLVFDGTSANISGFVNIYEALSSSEPFINLHNFTKPIRKLNEDTTLTDAINIMQKENLKIVLITRIGPTGRERILGIVTMKDLVEEVFGELAEW
jgi:putative hemolysin